MEGFITWKDDFEEINPVFINAGVLAGFEETEGFRLFHYSLIEAFWEPVQAAFIADGSGRDAAGLSLADYASRKTIPERGRIDPVEGMIAIIDAVNGASRFNLGVDGYFNIMLIDGRQKDYSKRLVEINDHRAKLASEIVAASKADLVSTDAAYGLIKGLIFGSEGFPRTAARFVASARSRSELSHFLRGYR